MSDVEERQNHGGCHRLIPRTGDILGGMRPGYFALGQPSCVASTRRQGSEHAQEGLTWLPWFGLGVARVLARDIADVPRAAPRRVEVRVGSRPAKTRGRGSGGSLGLPRTGGSEVAGCAEGRAGPG